MAQHGTSMQGRGINAAEHDVSTVTSQRQRRMVLQATGEGTGQGMSDNQLSKFVMARGAGMCEKGRKGEGLSELFD